MFASRDRQQGSAGLVDAAFTDRLGGVSAPPFDSLDLGPALGDRAAERSENLARLAAGFGVETFAVMQQVHGHEVFVVGSRPVHPPPRCDALVTSTAGVALCVRVADCVPVLLADTARGVIGAAHAGRDGVVAGVVVTTVAAMKDLGADTISAWVGPHVCGGCYEVPSALRAEVSAVEPSAFGCTTWGTPSVDLGAAISAQLLALGCVVVDRSRCTRESADLYSYRRDGPAAGRAAGVIVLREAT